MCEGEGVRGMLPGVRGGSALWVSPRWSMQLLSLSTLWLFCFEVFRLNVAKQNKQAYGHNLAGSSYSFPL